MARLSGMSEMVLCIKMMRIPYRICTTSLEHVNHDRSERLGRCLNQFNSQIQLTHSSDLIIIH